MGEEVKQIGQRLRGLREGLEMSVEEFADSCQISLDNYLAYESGEKDMTISVLKEIAERYNVDVMELLYGDQPRMSSYFLTRKGRGASINRVETYKYQTLSGGFNNRKADVFEVTVEPKVAEHPMHLSQHSGQEFNLILEGRLKMHIDGKELILEEGDSIYYDSSKSHGMQPMDGKRVRFLSVIL